MIHNREILAAFERALLRRSPPDIQGNQRMMEWMYQEAKSVGAMPRKEKLGDIEFKIRYARDLHVRKADRRAGADA